MPFSASTSTSASPSSAICIRSISRAATATAWSAWQPAPSCSMVHRQTSQMPSRVSFTGSKPAAWSICRPLRALPRASSLSPEILERSQPISPAGQNQRERKESPMINRRVVLAIVAASFAAAATPTLAQDWKAKYPEIVFTVVPAENATGVTERYASFVAYLSNELGTKVTLRVANDYAALIEGQRAGNIHIGMYGPASFARALLTGVKTEAFAIEVNGDGTKGYHSVFYVKMDSPYQKVEDLKGKNLGLVDPNSTSGNNVPRFALNQMGIEPDQFFAKVIYTGSHENAITALQQGTVDVAANWWNDETESNLQRMARKGMAKADDFRIIYKSDLIVNSPMAYLSDLPEDLKAAIRNAVLNIATKDKAAFDRVYEGKMRPLEAVDSKAYEPVIKLIKFVDELKKKESS